MMKCKQCGELDDTNTAYCIRCARSPHELVKGKELKKLKEDSGGDVRKHLLKMGKFKEDDTLTKLEAELKDKFFQIFGYQTGGTMGDIDSIIKEAIQNARKEMNTLLTDECMGDFGTDCFVCELRKRLIGEAKK